MVQHHVCFLQLLDNIENKMKDTVVEVQMISCAQTTICTFILSFLFSQGTIPGLFEGKMEVWNNEQVPGCSLVIGLGPCA